MRMDRDQSRQEAIDRLDELEQLLRRERDPPIAALVEECEQLKRSVKAFHMEAIRFRIYSLERKLTDPASRAPARARTLINAARAALEAAGFQTKSIDR